jgi:hypothetical protein
MVMALKRKKLTISEKIRIIQVIIKLLIKRKNTSDPKQHIVETLGM